MLKRVDVAVYNAFRDARAGTWKPGRLLKEDGVGYALDEYNRGVLTPDIVAKLEAARADIIAGRLVVKDYHSTQK